MSDHLRLVLGTAQLGMPYGIANRTGQPDIAAAREIVKTACNNGICEFDTAQAYGESEKVLGQVLKDLGIESQAKITTKPHPNLDHRDHESIFRSIEQSLKRLHVNKLQCVMLHRETTLDLWQEGLREILQSIVEGGMAEHAGISVYSPAKALLALNMDGIDTVQIPSNIFDRRFEKAGVFHLAQNLGKQTYVRSVFLQGLIFMAPQCLPQHIRFAFEALEELSALCKAAGLTRQELALGYVHSSYPDAKILFGAEKPEQVGETVRAFLRPSDQGMLQRVREAFPDVAETILNPSVWSP